MSLPWSDKGQQTDNLVAEDEFMIIDSTDDLPSTKNKRATLENVQRKLITDISGNSKSITALGTLTTDNLTAFKTLTYGVTEVSGVVSPTDVIVIGVTTAASFVTLASVAIVNGRQFWIKDQSGGAAGGNITIVGQGGELIDGESSIKIVANYGAVHLYAMGGALYSLPLGNSSTVDETGTDNSTVIAREMEDMADYDTTKSRWVLKRIRTSSGNAFVRRVKRFFVSDSILITAGQTLRITSDVNEATPLIFSGSNKPLFMTLPLLSGIITGFEINNSIVQVNCVGHDLKDNDVTKIINSRVEDLNGDHIVTKIDDDSFTIPVTWTSDDGPCTWKQISTYVTGTTNSTDDPGTKTTLLISNHPFVDGDYINVRDATNITENSYLVSNVVENVSVDIEFVYPGVSTTANVDTAHNGISLFRERLVSTGTDGILFDLTGHIPSRSFAFLQGTFAIGFELGETRNHTFAAIRFNSVLVGSYGWKSLNDNSMSVVASGLTRFDTPTKTSHYQSIVEIGNNNNVTLSSTTATLDLAENFSGFNVPDIVSEGSNGLFTGTLTDPDPGTYFKNGYYAQAIGNISSGTSGIVIPITDTSRFREGDSISVITSTSYADETGIIVSGGIITDTSIEVDIAFVAADANVLILNTSMVSLTQRDPKIIATSNPGLPNSMTVGELNFYNATGIAVTIVSTGVAVPINGTLWLASNLERISVSSPTAGNGKMTIENLEDDEYNVTYGATISKSGTANIIGIVLIKNGTDNITPNAFRVELGANAEFSFTGLVSTATLNTGDTVEIGVINYDSDEGPITVTAGSLHIGKSS